MICKNCGNLIGEKAAFCSCCGAQIISDERGGMHPQRTALTNNVDEKKDTKSGLDILIVLITATAVAVVGIAILIILCITLDAI